MKAVPTRCGGADERISHKSAPAAAAAEIEEQRLNEVVGRTYAAWQKQDYASPL